jgi:DNA invertase Pin-like site-specific DNA recombinase
LAEHERALISVRTRDALTAAKARGVVLGGRRHDLGAHAAKASATAARKRTVEAKATASDMAQAIADARNAIGADASLRAIANELTRRGVRSPRGSTVTASTVQRALALAA